MNLEAMLSEIMSVEAVTAETTTETTVLADKTQLANLGVNYSKKFE